MRKRRNPHPQAYGTGEGIVGVDLVVQTILAGCIRRERNIVAFRIRYLAAISDGRQFWIDA